MYHFVVLNSFGVFFSKASHCHSFLLVAVLTIYEQIFGIGDSTIPLEGGRHISTCQNCLGVPIHNPKALKKSGASKA